jgi:periplasmic copper chaperone A
MRTRCSFMALLLSVAIATPSAALAQPPVSAEDAWVRAAPPAATVMAGYLTLQNRTRDAVALVGVSSPQFERVELHRSAVVDGVARMEAVESIVVPAGGEAALAPGGLHMMLIGPQQPLPEGSTVEVTLAFDNGWELELNVPVRRAGR